MLQKTPIRIAVIGAGALGTEVILRMVSNMELRSRITDIVIIDPDRIDPENVATSRLFGEMFQRDGTSLHGRMKAEIAVEFLQLHGWRATALCDEIADVSGYTLRNEDLLVCCPDNALARVEATYTARILGLPLLDAGVLGDVTPAGRVTWFAPQPEAACYLCGLAEQRRADLLTYALSSSLSCRLPATLAMSDVPLACEALQQTATVLLAQLQRYCQSSPTDRTAGFSRSFALRLRVQKGTWNSETTALPVSPSCPWHPPAHHPLVAVDADQTFAEVLAASPWSGSERLQFAWPLCLRASCRRCGATDEQPRRVAEIRRKGYCHACKTSHQLEPLHIVGSVGPMDAMAKKTPRQLGWNGRLLLELRPALTLQSGEEH